MAKTPESAKAKCEAFVTAALKPATKAKAGVVGSPFGLDFLDGPIALVIQGLNAADVALDVIIEWVPRIALEVLTFSKSVKDIIAEVLSKSEGGETP